MTIPRPIDDWLARELQKRHRLGLYRSPSITRGLGPGMIEVNGEPLINFGGNDYLGLASHPAVIQAASTPIAHRSIMLPVILYRMKPFRVTSHCDGEAGRVRW